MFNFSVLRKIACKAKASVCGFKGNTDGGLAVIYGLTMIPLVFGIGVAIDMARLSHSQAKITTAMDAATLAAAAATNQSDAQRVKIAEKTYLANMPTGLYDMNARKAEFKIVNGNVEGVVHAAIPMTLTKALGFATVDVAIESEVSIKRDKKAEIALVLDYSGSMEEVAGGQVKYVAMRKAATKLVEDIAAIDKTRVKFALVPFSHHVLAPLPAAFVANANYTGTRLVCTQDRPYPANLSHDTPGNNNAEKWGQPQAPEHRDVGCDGYASRSLQVRPLTSDFDVVKDQLAAMRPYAWTHIALGAEFGHHVLSKNAPFSEGAESSDQKTEKFMVLLTDGKQTEAGFGASGTRDVAQAEKNLLAICGNAKAEGIKIIAIAYDLDDSTTRKNLQSCASSNKQFFVVENEQALDKAFDSIKDLLVTQMYVSR